MLPETRLPELGDANQVLSCFWLLGLHELDVGL